ncbi:hypothetical protein HD806DRAFT_315160 [Xylariaceae sp. AK1471]|nr:hypothetical protein HD806DRAFT_315160 [Xylariaceae sp. AK1471]
MSELQVISQESSSLDFSQFSRLPPELRFMIWEKAMEDPRIIHTYTKYRLRPAPRKLTINGITFEQVPKFFFVNHECRQIAIKFYPVVKVPNHAFSYRPKDAGDVNMHIKSNDIFAFHCLQPKRITRYDFPIHPRTSPRVPIQSYMFVTKVAPVIKEMKSIASWVEAMRTGEIEEYVASRYARHTYKYSISSWSLVLRHKQDPIYFDLEDLTSVPGDPELVSNEYPWDIELFKPRGSTITYTSETKD